MAYQLSLLDKAPVAEGESPAAALQRTLRLAQQVEKWGYHRFWLAEHHNVEQLASPSPEVLIAWIAAQTTRIRLGSGGVMLQHYSPYKVAENFNVLASLAPDVSIWVLAKHRAACRFPPGAAARCASG